MGLFLINESFSFPIFTSAKLNEDVPPFDHLVFVDERRGLAVYTAEGGLGTTI